MRYFKSLLFPDGNVNDLLYWRERILRSFLAVSFIIGLIIIVPALKIHIKLGYQILPFVITGAVVFSAVILLFPSAPLTVRAYITVLIMYMISISIIYHVGVFSGGPYWLFTISILCALLFGIRVSLVTVIINVIIFIISGYYGIRIGLAYDKGRLILGIISFFVLNAMSAVSISVLIKALQTIIRKKEEASAELKVEKEKLEKAKNDLDDEIEIRKKAEEILQENEQQHRFIAENITDVIFIVDMGLNFNYISPVAAKIHGWPVEDLQTKIIDDFMTPESITMAQEYIFNQLEINKESGNYQSTMMIELDLYRSDGATFPAEFTAKFLLNKDGVPEGIMGVMRDISIRRQAEIEREELSRQLERSKKMEALGLLAGGVAHDLNNVLSGIVSYPDLILLDLDESSPLRKPIETIHESGKKAATIVQDLLALARRGVVSKDVVDLNGLIASYLESPEYKRIMMYHESVIVQTRLDEDLPLIEGSEIHLRKSLMNLVLNAAEAQLNGGAIVISTRKQYLDKPLYGYKDVKPGIYAVISVEDSGEGIAGEDLQRIFEPFYTKKVMGRSGTGLGMAVVWGTVQDHEGYIVVNSEINRGSCFELYLPANEDLHKKDADNIDMPLYQGNKEFILIVDDIREQREIAVDIVSRLNYTSYAVSSGEEAVEYCREHEVDLILLDMIMDSGIDGLDTFLQISEFKKEQKVVVVSGFSESKRLRKLQKLGAKWFVKKPYSLVELAKVLHSAFEE